MAEDHLPSTANESVDDASSKNRTSGLSLEPVTEDKGDEEDNASASPAEGSKPENHDDGPASDNFAGLSLEPMADNQQVEPKKPVANTMRLFSRGSSRKRKAREEASNPLPPKEGTGALGGSEPSDPMQNEQISDKETASGEHTLGGEESERTSDGEAKETAGEDIRGPAVTEEAVSDVKPMERGHDDHVNEKVAEHKGGNDVQAHENVAPKNAVPKSSLNVAEKMANTAAALDKNMSAQEAAADKMPDPEATLPSFFPRRDEQTEDKKEVKQLNLEQLPAKLGRYLLMAELGHGSLGVVYRGVDTLNDQEVAVKVLKNSSSGSRTKAMASERRRTLFFDEVRAAAMMRHPYILQVFDMGEDDGLCYIVMELVVDAGTLRDYTKEGNLLSYEKMAGLIRMCALALDHVHGRGVVHRDIKPENILITDKDTAIKVADFGVAGLYRDEGSQKASKEILGSPKYMSPEQLRGQPLAGSSDFYSLGVIIYEMITGQHPFHARNLKELCQKILSGKPPPLSEYRNDVPPMLQAIVDRALSKKASTRFQSGRELIEELAAIFPGLKKYKVFSDGVARLATDLGKLSFFEEFDKEDLRFTAEICLREDYRPGMDIIEEGAVRDSVYIIVKGDVLVHKGAKELGRLHAGQCFGEMGYLTSIKRTATVTAVRKACLVKFNFNLVSKLPPIVQLKFSRAFIRILVERLARTTNQLIEID